MEEKKINNEIYVTPKQAAELTGFSHPSIVAMLHSGRIPGAKKIDHKIVPMSWVKYVIDIKQRQGLKTLPRWDKGLKRSEREKFRPTV